MCQKAKRSYQKDVASFQEARNSNALALNDQESKYEMCLVSKDVEI